MADIKFEIKETIGVLSESTKGWSKELSLLVGMIKTQSTIFGNGRQIIRRWGKV